MIWVPDGWELPVRVQRNERFHFGIGKLEILGRIRNVELFEDECDLPRTWVPLVSVQGYWLGRVRLAIRYSGGHCKWWVK